MSLPTESSSMPDTIQNIPIIQLDQVGVRYRVPQERIPSIKEYAIRWMKRQVGYKTFWALHDVDLTLYEGDVLGIIGPNGAGKSTLLKVVSKVLRPTSGRVRVNGRVAPLLELGAGFDTELTGRENIYLNGTILGASKQNVERRIDRIIEFSGLGDFIDAPVRTYSTGMVARLGFSIATDVRPEILIVDEILGVGDAEFQTKSYERIQSFRRDGTTILLVSHDLGSVESMCSRGMWLDHGKIVTTGTAKSVIDQYLQRTREKESERLASVQQAKDIQRWGNRKAEIVSVHFMNGTGVPQSIFQTGQPFEIKIDYDFHEDIEVPIFGMAIHRHDGVHITGPNTGQVGLRRNILKGSGTIRYTIPNLPLLDGLYHVSLAIVNDNDTEVFDYHDRAYPFRVNNQGREVVETFGLMTLRGKWRFENLD